MSVASVALNIVSSAVEGTHVRHTALLLSVQILPVLEEPIASPVPVPVGVMPPHQAGLVQIEPHFWLHELASDENAGSAENLGRAHKTLVEVLVLVDGLLSALSAILFLVGSSLTQ
eukprot:CAMPEP_0168610682 /NCGR_PEP_ID=MMETSP0449_2-20121227/1921_1 /TAXON_ID=1082188 /ORGANISM="Strombidium rassoulzadegani, Strain ras09" /LENGTH=115 /DNA_ID=CAMNT_0008651011 /DNA_START=425 /DNA_END=772 /DNA_ORIENTATION=+